MHAEPLERSWPDCGTPTAGCTTALHTVDPQATPETVALYQQLKTLEGTHSLFGHQDDLAYGMGWNAEPGRSDVEEVTGSLPSVLGFDVGRIETGSPANIDGVDVEKMKGWIEEGADAGSVITLSWHSLNPVTGGDYSDNTSPDAITHVLPGGDRHQVLTDWLDRFAAFDRTLVDSSGTQVPIVFRPYHEHSGDWFWWGIDDEKNNTAQQYAELWRSTVDYLTQVTGVHNLLYAISPDRSRLDASDLANEYLQGYPGDDYVDVLGVDDYWDTQNGGNPVPFDQQYATYVKTLETVSDLARQRGKIAALTETGTAPTDDRWTGYLGKALETNARTRRIVWSLVWRNADAQSAYAPYPGAPSAPDFTAFAADPFILFNEPGLPDLYSRAAPTAASVRGELGCYGRSSAFGLRLQQLLSGRLDTVEARLAKGQSNAALVQLAVMIRQLDAPQHRAQVRDEGVRVLLDRGARALLAQLAQRTGTAAPAV